MYSVFPKLNLINPVKIIFLYVQPSSLGSEVLKEEMRPNLACQKNIKYKDPNLPRIS